MEGEAKQRGEGNGERSGLMEGQRGEGKGEVSEDDGGVKVKEGERVQERLEWRWSQRGE